MIALYASVFSFVSLLFDYINYTFPDALVYVEPYSGGMRSEMATLIILFPIFLLLMRIVRRDIVEVPEKRELWVRRWAIVLTMFIAGITIAIDLITLITDFLGGELTTPFMLKAFIILLVAVGGFLHFLADMRGWWDTHEDQLRSVAIATSVLIVVALATGFVIMGSPAQVRLYRLDAQRISDLEQIEWQVGNYEQQKSMMPQSITDLNDPSLGYIVPTDPQTHAPYEYQKTGDRTFRLCAIFSAETQANIQGVAPIGPYGPVGSAQENWYHLAGHACFDRTVPPAPVSPVTAPVAKPVR